MPSVVLIGGIWRSGKTSTALWISEMLIKYGLVDKVSSNIDTQGAYKQISDIVTLKMWLHKDKKTKLFIFDEANMHIPSRRAMSNKNVKVLSLLPEISKAHGRMIVIGQRLEKIDSEYRDTTWIRAVFHKINRKTVRVISPLLKKSYLFRNIPKTTIPFDPDVLAPFTERPVASALLKDEELQLLDQWLNGGTWKELFDHPQQCNRFVRRKCRELLDSYIHYSHLIA